MSNRLLSLEVHNFRSLVDVTIETSVLNILFGPNGAGKSTLLDTVWLVRDCENRGVDKASSDRNHGIGMLWDRAQQGANISIKLETELTQYEVTFGYSSGRIEPYVGERLYSKSLGTVLIERQVGSDKANFYHYKMCQTALVSLREPEKLALTKYLDFEEGSQEASELGKLLRYVNSYRSRAIDLYRLKKHGSESSYHTYLWDRGQNLWSLLQNLLGQRAIDERYDTIIDFMRAGFPTFDDLVVEQTGPNTVYGSFVEKGRRRPIQASGVSDGHLQMLVLLTALFSEGKDRGSLILFDEPEMSLHPYALSVFAQAVELATREWNKQVFIATHSPVLMSQFSSENVLAMEIGEFGQTVIKRVSEIVDIQDLLQEYAIGSLYMSEMVAPQSPVLIRETGE